MMENKTYKNDKKLNMNYWDDIDNIVEKFIKELLSQSDTEIENLDVYQSELTAETRDFAVKLLEKHGATFPFVKENY